MTPPKKPNFELARFTVGAILSLVALLLHAYVKDIPIGAWFVIGLAFGYDSTKLMPWKK